MKRIAGVAILLVILAVLLGVVNPRAFNTSNLKDVLNKQGLFVYRGLARVFAGDREIGLSGVKETLENAGNDAAVERYTIQINVMRRWLVGYDEKGFLEAPMTVLVLALVALVAAVVLHKTV